MIKENEYFMDLENLEVWRNELIKKLVPDEKSNCIGFYKERFDQKNLEFNNNLFDCRIIEIVTNISINSKNFKNLITKAGFKLLDVTYGPKDFKFLIQKIE